MHKEFEEISEEELEKRVVYSAFLPAIRLAGVFSMSLKEVKTWAAIAYLQEIKRKGKLTQIECAEQLNVSRRTIIDLSKRLKENFFLPEQYGLHRRIFFMLWAESMSEGRLLQALKNDFEVKKILEALKTLTQEKKIEKVDTRTTAHYRLATNIFRLQHDHWINRIDALNHQASVFADTVYARFFAKNPYSFVRTIGFSIRKEDRSQLERFYEEVVFPKLQTLDAASEDDPDAELFDFAISWVPRNFIEQFQETKTK